MLESWRQREQFSSFSFSLLVHVLSISFFLKRENNKKAIFYMCVYTQTVTAIGPERKREREREMTSGASSPAGGYESVHLLGSLLLFHRKYIVVSFRRFVCGAVHKNVAKEKTSSAALYTTQRTHTHKF
jgi:hypothetical protein